MMKTQCIHSICCQFLDCCQFVSENSGIIEPMSIFLIKLTWAATLQYSFPPQQHYNIPFLLITLVNQRFPDYSSCINGPGPFLFIISKYYINVNKYINKYYVMLFIEANMPILNVDSHIVRYNLF